MRNLDSIHSEVGITQSPSGPTMGIPTQPTAPVPLTGGGPTMGIPTQPTAPASLTPAGPTMGIPTQPTPPIPLTQVPGMGGGQTTTRRPSLPAPTGGVMGGGTPGQAPAVPAFNPNQPPASFSPYNVVSDYMNNLTNQNSPYMQNARRRGLEHAAARGSLNSSIAAGASQRAALEAAQPLVSEMASMQKQRESYASQDWLASNQFDREFAGALAMLPIQNSYQMLNALFQYAAEDPATYTPAVVNQMSNFFTQNMQNVMSNYFNTSGGNP